MTNQHVNLTPQENSLIDRTHPDVLARMDEKSLKELQRKLRQAREKNFSLLRRQGAVRVEAEGGRGAAQFTMIAASAYCPQHLGQPITQAPPPPQQSPVIDFPRITPGAG